MSVASDARCSLGGVAVVDGVQRCVPNSGGCVLEDLPVDEGTELRHVHVTMDHWTPGYVVEIEVGGFELEIPHVRQATMLMPVDRGNVHLQFLLGDGDHDFFQFQLKGVGLELLSMTCSAPVPPPPPAAVQSPSVMHAGGEAAALPGAELTSTTHSSNSDGGGGGPIKLAPGGASVGAPRAPDDSSDGPQGLSAGLVFGTGLLTAVGLYLYHRRHPPHGIWGACASMMKPVRIESASDLEMPEAVNEISGDMPSDAEDDEGLPANEPPPKPQRGKHVPGLQAVQSAASKTMMSGGRCRKYDDLEETEEGDYDHVHPRAVPSGRSGKPHRARKG
jgi:hypothetical protein